MKKRFFSMLLVLVLVLAMLPMSAFAYGPRGNGDGNPYYYNSSDRFGWDAFTYGGSTAGVTSVKVGGTSLSVNSAGSTTGAAVQNGIDLVFTPGYYLEKYKIVCGDKYSCQTDASYNLTVHVGANATGSYSISPKKEDFSHSSRRTPYWLLLSVKQNSTRYPVTYNWGELAGKLQSAAPVDTNSPYLINSSPDVLAASEAALNDAKALGYQFAGWLVSGTGYAANTILNAGSKLLVTSALTLTAQWEPLPEAKLTVKKLVESDYFSSLEAEKYDFSIVITEPGKAPTSTRFQLAANETWSATLLTGSTYEVTESQQGASWTVDQAVQSGTLTQDTTVTFTNTYTYEEKAGQIALTIRKQDAVTEQPLSGATFSLYSDEACQHMLASANSGASGNAIFDRLDLALGEAEKRTVYLKETTAPEGYRASDTVYPITLQRSVRFEKDAAGKLLRITDITASSEQLTLGNNTLTLGNDAITDLTVQKIWKDDPEYGYRPQSVTLALYDNAACEGQPIERITLSEQDAADDFTWRYTFSGMPVYDQNGEKITYAVQEVETDPNYTAEANGLTVKNTLKIFDFQIYKYDTLTGELAAGAKFALYDNAACEGQPVQTGVSGPLSDSDGDNCLVFAGLTVGKTYYLVETEAPEGFLRNETVYEITDQGSLEANFLPVGNTRATTITLNKVWDDADDNDATRPQSVQVQLYANGTAYGDPITLRASEGWKKVIEAPMLEAGNDYLPIEYSVRELTVEGYESVVTATKTAYVLPERDEPTPYSAAEPGSAYTYYSACEFRICNTHEPDTSASVTAQKLWQDDENRDGLRPQSVTVALYQDGTLVQGSEITLSAENGWRHTYSGLQTYKAGQKIAYSVREQQVPEGYTASYKTAEDGTLQIINTHEVQTMEKTVKKTWVDGNSASRPSSVTVQLLANGKACGEPVTLSAKNGWSYTWKLYCNHEGKEIKYTVQELKVPSGYQATYSKDGFTITNTLKEIPQTGDSSISPLYPILMVLCAAGVVALILVGHKKKKGS